MDSYKLREEHSKLVKDVDQLKHVKEVMDKRVKELHVQEMKYLDEIPELRKTWEKQKYLIDIYESKYKDAYKALEDINVKYQNLKKLAVIENEKLGNLIESNSKESFLLNKQKEDIKDQSNELRIREEALRVRERECDARELVCIDREEAVFKSEVKLKKLQEFVNISNKELEANVEIHKIKVSKHDKKEADFIENKKYHSFQEEELKQKLQQIDKIIKENSALKSQLLLQADKLSKELQIAKDKQVSLDRNIADLDNQSNVLKIKELRIKKLAHDNGLIKELRELEASVK